MTTDTQHSLDKSYIESYSKANNEPEWFTSFRLAALEKMDTLEMPKPDKTKIDRWNFTSFKQHTVENKAYDSIDALPEEVKALLDLEGEVKNLYVQLNQTPGLLTVSEKLKEQGVIF